MTLALALAVATVGTTLPAGFSTPLLTWTGVIAVVLGLLLLGVLIPRSSHLREIRLLKESHAREMAAHLSAISDRDAQILAWRGVADVRSASETELLAQHRMTIDALSSINYSIDQMRSGMERAQRGEATHG